jgi:hypothetical protein
LEFDKLTKSEILKEVNKNSLTNLLMTSNLSELSNQLKATLETDNIDTFVYTNILGFRNYSDAMPVLEKAGYNFNGHF